MARDRIFLWFIAGLFLIMLLYGGGMMVIIFSDGNHTIATSMITGFSSMFSGMIGIGAGYLFGAKGEGNSG